MCYQGLRGEEAIQTFCLNFATLGIKCLAFVSSEEFIKNAPSIRAVFLFNLIFFFFFLKKLRVESVRRPG